MADQTALADVGHYYGSDVIISPTGDLSPAVRAERSRQRVLRRLLTNPGEVIFHPEYGAGLPRLVGTNANGDEIAALIKAQMRLEPSVDQTTPPVIEVTTIPNGISVKGTYVVLPDRQPVPLSFSLDV